MTYGYIRVSSRDQNEDRQLTALKAWVTPENIYMDKQSGKDFNRPQYKKLVRRLKKDDLLYVKSIDRLGRNYEEIQNQWRILTKEKGIDIVVLDMPLLDTRRGKDLMGTFLSDIVLQVLSSLRKTSEPTSASGRRKGSKRRKPGASGLEGAAGNAGAFRENCAPVGKEKNKHPGSLERSGMSESTFYRKARMYRTPKK